MKSNWSQLTSGLAVLIGAGCISFGCVPAHAEITDASVVDTEPLTAVTANGVTTVVVRLTSTGATDQPIPATATVTGHSSCTPALVGAHKQVLPAQGSTTVRVVFPEGCFKDSSLAVDLDGTGGLPAVEVKPPEKDEPPYWGAMWTGLWAGGFMFAVVFVAGIVGTVNARSALKKGEANRLERYKAVRSVVNARIAELNKWTLDPTNTFLLNPAGAPMEIAAAEWLIRTKDKKVSRVPVNQARGEGDDATKSKDEVAKIDGFDLVYSRDGTPVIYGDGDFGVVGQAGWPMLADDDLSQGLAKPPLARKPLMQSSYGPRSQVGGLEAGGPSRILGCRI